MLMGGRLRPRQGDLVKKCGKGAKLNLAKSSDSNHGPEIDLKWARFWAQRGSWNGAGWVAERTPMTTKTTGKREAAPKVKIALDCNSDYLPERT
jgi:hypothetical protein